MLFGECRARWLSGPRRRGATKTYPRSRAGADRPLRRGRVERRRETNDPDELLASSDRCRTAGRESGAARKTTVIEGSGPKEKILN